MLLFPKLKVECFHVCRKAMVFKKYKFSSIETDLFEKIFLFFLFILIITFIFINKRLKDSLFF